MILDRNGNIRLTKSEFNKLRQENAKNGEILGSIKTDEDLLAAAINGLPDEIVNDMILYFETGTSPLFREGASERADSNSPRVRDGN